MNQFIAGFLFSLGVILIIFGFCFPREAEPFEPTPVELHYKMTKHGFKGEWRASGDET